MNPKDKHADWLLKPTANELADEVEMWGKDLLALNMKGGIPVIEGAKLLRQQQAEIEALKQIIDANNLNQNIGQFVKPTNKPVAWMDYLEHSDVYDLNVSGRGIPLYTHPAELTDEEIKTTTITEVLNYFEEARYELDADFVFKLKKHFQICGEEE